MDTKKLETAQNLIDQARGLLEEVRDAEQEAFDDKSSEWQEGEKGEECMSRIDGLNEIVDSLEQIDVKGAIS